MTSLPWLRLYTELLSDRKIKLISAETGLPKPLIIGVWVSLLMLAGESPERGRIISARGKAWPFAFIADEIGLDEPTCQQIIDEFAGMNMIYQDEEGAYVVVKWDERQFKSDDAYARVKKFRAEKRGKVEPPEVKGGIENDGYAKRIIVDERNVSRAFQETDQSQIQNPDINQEEEKERHPDFAKVCTAYQYEIGGLSQTVSDSLDDDIRTYSATWVIEAMKRAAKANARNLNYVEAILKNWEAIGGPQNDKPRGQKKNGAYQNGQHKSTKQPTEKPDLTNPDTWAAQLEAASGKRSPS